MISIFRSTPSAPPAESCSRVLSLLSQALQLSMIKARDLNHQELSAALDGLVDDLDQRKAEAVVLEASGKVCGSVQRYFQLLGQGIDAVGFDLATSIRALATLLHGNSGDQTQFLGQMEQIRDKFQAGHTLDDIHTLRHHLDSCLTSLRSQLFEARKTQQQNQEAMLEHISKLHRSVSTLKSKVPQKHTTGPALSILRVRRLKAVKDRYGPAVAQRMLDFVIQILLVRWPAAYDITPYTDECLVVIDSQNLDLDFHRSALRNLSGEKSTFTTEYEGHELILPIALDWTVLRAPAEGDMDAFIRNFLNGMDQKDTQTAALDKALQLSR